MPLGWLTARRMMTIGGYANALRCPWTRCDDEPFQHQDSPLCRHISSCALKAWGGSMEHKLRFLAHRRIGPARYCEAARHAGRRISITSVYSAQDKPVAQKLLRSSEWI